MFWHKRTARAEGLRPKGNWAPFPPQLRGQREGRPQLPTSQASLPPSDAKSEAEAVPHPGRGTRPSLGFVPAPSTEAPT